MKVHLLGVRGSTPVSGADFMRYGGHTSCVAIVPAGSLRPTIILDAGTGLQLLSGLMADDPFVGTILCTHLHWDHVQGLPFARALDRPDSRVEIVVPGVEGIDAAQLVAGLMRPPYFPITPQGLGGSWTFTGATAAETTPVELQVGQARVRAVDVPHKGGRTLAFRVDLDGASLAYAPDHALAEAPAQPVIDLFSGVDVLLHDAQFRAEEAALSKEYGHSTIEQARELAVACGVGELVLTHHAPSRTDAALDALGADLAAEGAPVRVARGGDVLELPEPPNAT